MLRYNRTYKDSKEIPKQMKKCEYCEHSIKIQQVNKNNEIENIIICMLKCSEDRQYFCRQAIARLDKEQLKG